MSATSPTSRRIGAAATVAVLGAAVAVTALPSGAGAASWSSTSTKALSLTNATLLGKAPASTPLRLTVGLTPRHRGDLDELIKAQATKGSPYYEKFLTPAQFTSHFAATKTTAANVTKYLKSAGLKNVTVSSNRLQVTADATVASAEKAFDTSISSYRRHGHKVLANTAAARVPTALGKSVSGVLGLSTFKAQTTPAVTVPKLTGFYPKEFNTVYDSWDTKPGTGTSLGIIAEGDLTSTVKDLRVAEKAQKLPQVPVRLHYAGIKSPDTAGADEWDLDTQTSTGIAPNTKKLYVYIATSLTDADLARAINLFVSKDEAQAGSASLGECDALAMADGSTTIDDIAFAQAAVQGQTFFASSGDTGSSCAVLPTNGVPASGPPDTSYPASSPYVTGVGGTTLDADSTTDAYGTEIAWNAGGGGISPVENQPYWQNGVSPVSTPVTSLRGVPDVAFDADPTTGGNIYVGGTPETIGGTSLASPLALGLWTRLNASHGNKLGFAPPKLYALYKKAQGSSALPPTSVPGFHDIIAGGNGTYVATPGYDYTTGLGSWDVKKLDLAIK